MGLLIILHSGITSDSAQEPYWMPGWNLGQPYVKRTPKHYPMALAQVTFLTPLCCFYSPSEELWVLPWVWRGRPGQESVKGAKCCSQGHSQLSLPDKVGGLPALRHYGSLTGQSLTSEPELLLQGRLPARWSWRSTRACVRWLLAASGHGPAALYAL